MFKNRRANRNISYRKTMAKIQNHRCYYCQVLCTNSGHYTKTSKTLDHIIPLKNNGKTALDNVVLSCRQCNQNKSNMSEDNFRAKYDFPKNIFSQTIRYYHSDVILITSLYSDDFDLLNLMHKMLHHKYSCIIKNVILMQNI